MMTDARLTSDQRSLLGLRPPADLAWETVDRLESPAGTALPSQARHTPRPAPLPGNVPPRPNYPMISTAADAEEDAQSSKGSDLIAAIRAGVVLVVLLFALAMLIKG